MWGYRFINEMAQGWQHRDWMKLSDTCPYSMSHRKQRGSLPFVSDYHFDRYYGGHATTTRMIHKLSKRKKLYWHLHPQYKRW